MRTPETKSSIDSGVEDLFFPRLTARSAPWRNDEVEESSVEKNDGMRARNRDRTDAWPWEGKPYRLMMAESSGRWNTRGRGLPG